MRSRAIGILKCRYEDGLDGVPAAAEWLGRLFHAYFDGLATGDSKFESNDKIKIPQIHCFAKRDENGKFPDASDAFREDEILVDSFLRRL
jgi:hypothetical protein